MNILKSISIILSISSIYAFANTPPTAELLTPSEQTLSIGQTLEIRGQATDPDGNLAEHWLEIRNPSGVWSWEGWMTNEPWAGAIEGDGYNSIKQGVFQFDTPGVYLVRTTSIDSTYTGWTISNEVAITVVNTPPTAEILSPSAQTILIGQTLEIKGQATDPDGNLAEHWLEIRNPSGVWSWEGWMTNEPWAGAIEGNGYNSIKQGLFQFDTPGIYLVRTTSIDSTYTGWTISNEVAITVLSAAPGNTPPTAELLSPSSRSITLGETLQIRGRAVDPDGNLAEHWLEIRNPSGAWSWEGWMTNEPWAGAIQGDGYSSTKEGSFQFNTLGTYLVRTTSIDSTYAGWTISNEVAITVVAPVTLGHINIPTAISATNGSAYSQVNFSINDNGPVYGTSRYYQNQPNNDPYITYSIYDAYSGPGYVVWTVRTSRDGPVGTNQISQTHSMKIAIYQRHTRSWTVSTVKEYNASYNLGYQYRSANVGPIGVLEPHRLQWMATLQDSAYNITFPSGFYYIPAQPL
jgi:hypothetical protein